MGQKIIKITILMSILFFRNLQVVAQGNLVTATCNNTLLTTALYYIEKQSGYYKVNYNSNELRNMKTSANIKNKLAPEAVKELIKNLPLTFTIKGRIITIVKSKNATTTAPQGQSTKIRISGQLMDSEGMPLIGAVVKEQGTTHACVTDYDGKFSLDEVDKNAMIEYSYVGMETFRRKASVSPVKIFMQSNQRQLKEVIVNGYQTLSRERSAGSYDVVKAADFSEKANLTGDILSGLEGLTTGIAVNNSMGADKFTVRGITSINSNRSPLFVLDGVPLESSQIESLVNSNDIESVTLLKDATAASIWGSQAANGVVVITTKNGQKATRLRISYNGSFTYTGKPDYGYQNLMDGRTFMDNAQEMFDAYCSVYTYDNAKNAVNGLQTGYVNPVIMPHERIMYQYANGEITAEQKQAALQKLIKQDGHKSYEDNLMSNKFMTRHSVAFTGGGNKSDFYLSLNYTGNQGISKDWTNLFGVTAKHTLYFSDKVKWDITLNASYSNASAHLSPWKDYGTDGLLSFYTERNNLPYAVLADENGNLIDWSEYVTSVENRDKVEDLSGVDLTFHPTEDFQNSSSKSQNTNMRLNTGLTVNILKGLKYEGRLQYSHFHSTVENYYPGSTWRVREELLCSTPRTTLQPALPKSGGYFYANNGNTSDWTVRNQLSYTVSSVDEKHYLTAMLGTEVREYKNGSFNNFLRGYDLQTMKYTPYDDYNLNRVNNGLLGNSINAFTKTYYTQTELKRRYFSLYGNMAYTFRNCYTINGSIRMDQSNLFGSDPGTQYKPIWSIGGVWKMSEENFMKNFKWLDRCNLRMTYGFAGNSPQAGQGGKYDILTATSSSFFERPGYTITSPANGKITWEKTRTWNLGFDVAALHNRIALSFDFYNKKTTNLISDMLLNPFVGWASTVGNVGELSNKGFEFSVNTLIVKTSNFSWKTALTLTHNVNKIVKLDVATPYTASTLATISFMNVEGYPINSLFSYRYAGLNEIGEPQAYNKNGEIVAGVESRGLSADDVVYSGTTIPKFYGGLTNRFRYKDWELSFLLIYNFGAKMRKQCETMEYGRPTSNLLNDYNNRWRKAGDEQYTNIPGWSATKNATANYNLFYFSDANILDASFIKLRDLTIAYNFRPQWCQKVSAQSISVKFMIGNLFYWAANKEGIDPEYYNPTTYINSRQEKFGPSYAFDFNVTF